MSSLAIVIVVDAVAGISPVLVQMLAADQDGCNPTPVSMTATMVLPLPVFGPRRRGLNVSPGVPPFWPVLFKSIATKLRIVGHDLEMDAIFGLCVDHQ